MRTKKQINQNIFDFVLSNYGNLEEIDNYITDNSITNLNSFGDSAISTKFLDTTKSINNTLEYYYNRSILVATGVNPIQPDYNDDYNEDYLTDN